MNGVDLIKRYSSKETFGLTTPLITLASGAKMGKSESGAIWLDKNLLSHMITGNFGEMLMIEI